ncbi:MAG: hypothetical protein GYB32_01150 [Algicola sp.]|nr:hypothetical protein [Algicola sp.]
MNLIKPAFFTLVTFLSVIHPLRAQAPSKLITAFENYTESPREVSYLHLNKSLFVTGETMGFSSYVFDKFEKKPSVLTTNLYCVIMDENDKVIKKQLIKITDGYGSGQFDIDSTLTSGSYKIKAYTNWMRNFDEHNYYVQSFRVIDPEKSQRTNSKNISNQIDAQFLPEGGHLVAETQNTIGVIVKDSLGFGISNVEGVILSESNSIVGKFKTNQFGIGKFLLLPKTNERYVAQLKIDQNTYDFPIQKAAPKGICLSLATIGDKVAITLNTNEATLSEINKTPYQLTLHNGKTIKSIEVDFSDKLSLTKIITADKLFKGMNVFTLFDDRMNPILERLYFNYNGIDIMSTTDTYTVTKNMDSLMVSLPVSKNTSSTGKVSISILPEATRSYNHHNNIISQTYLRPYVKGIIENAAYYFKNIDRKKKFELDNLLITQGWSSYNWTSLFKNTPKITYNFENGISLIANVNNRETGQYLIFPTRLNGSEIVTIEDDDKNFVVSGFFPLEKEQLKIGELQKKAKIGKPSIYVQFGPSKIHSFGVVNDPMKQKQHTFVGFSDSQSIFQSSWENIEQLDEVVVNANKKEDRIEKLKKSAFDQIDVFDETKRRAFRNFASYIITQGFNVRQSLGSIVITNPRAVGSARTTPLVFLDGVLLTDLSVLYNFDMSIVDYVQINKLGFGEGIRGNAGSIKIFTDPSISVISKYGKTYQAYDIPLAFSRKKRFYTPVYNSYTSEFYEKYGVIGWVNEATIDSTNTINFSIFNTGTDRVKVFIEGVTNQGDVISEERILDLN